MILMSRSPREQVSIAFNQATKHFEGDSDDLLWLANWTVEDIEYELLKLLRV